MDLHRQYRINTAAGPLHETIEGLPENIPAGHPARFIAYYLPQFHAIAENDRWWGRGFTEWTNVTKALPQYEGHYQPRLPADLGFYDLANVETLRRQAELARRGGIYGFCIHNYWFSGHKLLETPLELLLANRDIDIRFCLNWANENWTRTWDGLERNVLIEQSYAPEDDFRYAESLLPAMADPRYIRIDGRPLVMIYRPGAFPDGAATVERWRSFFRQAGEKDPFIVLPQVFGEVDPARYGMDGAAGFPPHRVGAGLPQLANGMKLFNRDFSGNVFSYPDMVRQERAMRSTGFPFFPGVCPAWDNEARKPGRGHNLLGSTPSLYGDWLEDAARFSIEANGPDRAFVFINAWNEWAEGTYLEPDRHYGFAFLNETRRVLDALAIGTPRARPPVQGPSAHTPQPGTITRLRRRAVRKARRLLHR